jgi:selenoprotein W-related protein
MSQLAVPGDNCIVIHYCNLCRWMLRANWLAQELLTTFDSEIQEVSLRPGSGGVFEIWLNNELLWERKRDGGFPEAKEIKQRVRDAICPERDLGHSDS